MLKRPIPPRLTYRLQSEPIIVRIPQADPLLTIHLHGNELIFDPPYIVFTRSAEASFRTCTCRMPRHVCTCRTHALPSACSRVQHTPTCSRVQCTCMRSWVQPTHVFEGSTHQWLLPFKLSSLPIRYSTSLTAFDSTFAHTRTSSTPCSQPRHPTCDVCPYITCVWRHTLWRPSGKVNMACFSLLVLKSTLLLKKVKKSTA